MSFKGKSLTVAEKAQSFITAIYIRELAYIMSESYLTNNVESELTVTARLRYISRYDLRQQL